MSFYAKYVPPSAGGGGTVTSITAGTGLTGGTITSSGTIAFDQSHLTLDGSTSGSFTQRAANVTTTYSVKWPSAQGAASTFLQNDGAGNLSWAAGSGGGANTALSNLASTAVNADLVPGVTNTISVGTTAKRYTNGFFTTRLEVGANLELTMRAAATSPSGIVNAASVTTESLDRDLVVSTSTSGSGTANPSYAVRLETGNRTAGTGNSGDISLRTGTSSGGTRGKIKFVNGSEGTAGYVWTSIDTTGSGAWMAPSGGGSTSQDFVIQDSGSNTVGHLSTAAANDLDADIQLINTADSVDLQSYGIGLGTSNKVSTDNSRAVVVRSGRVVDGFSGDVELFSGFAISAGNSGIMNLLSGSVASGVSGLTTLSSGSASASGGTSGNVSVFSGSSLDSTTGNVSMLSGNSSTGTTGNVSLTTGTPGAGGTSGNIDLNTAATDGASSGHFIANTGGVNNSGNSGNIGLATGPSDTATSGSLAFSTGGANSGNTGNASITTGDSAGSGLSGTIFLTTGEIDSGTSGNITLATGPATTRGKIKFQDGSQGTSGYVWTSTDTVGSGAWMAAGGGGANTTLSNLGTTAINASLTFAYAASQRTIKTADRAANSSDILKITTGDTTAAANASGQLLIGTGDSVKGSGNISVTTGNPALNFNSGNINHTTNDASGSGASGSMTNLTGAADTGASGSITNQTGDSNNTSGSMYWQIGAGSTNNGQFNLVGPSTHTNLNISDVNWNTFQTTPPTLTAGAQAGSSPTAVFSGNACDTAGVMTIIPGAGVTAGEVLKLTYFGTMANGAVVILTPANNNAATAEATLGVWADGQSDSTFFTVNTNITLVAGTTYTWNYLVMGLQ